MREDYFEAIEKMFPDGFLIVYPIKGSTEVNMKTHCPNDDRANRLIWAIHNLIQEESGKSEDDE